MTDSRAKGARGELLACKAFSPHFADIERTAQHCGKDGQVGDIRSLEYLPKLHIEVKFGNTVNGGAKLGLGAPGLTAALDQAERDCPHGAFPVVLWRNTKTGGVNYPGITKWKLTYRCPVLEADVTVAGVEACARVMTRLNSQTGD